MEDDTLIGGSVQTTPKENQKPKRNNDSRKTTIIAVVLVVVLVALGAIVGFMLIPNSDNHSEDKVTEEVDPNINVNIDDERTKFDYGPWTDLNDYFAADSVGMLGIDRYIFRTTELCVNHHNWNRMSYDVGEHVYVVATPNLTICNLPRYEKDSYPKNKMFYGVELQVLEKLDDNWAKVKYLGGDLDKPVEGEYEGYVSMDFVVSAHIYDIMNQCILPTDKAKKQYSKSKWRIAAANVAYVVGADVDGPKVSIEVENVTNVDKDKESVVVFGITREDSPVKLLAVVEFFAEDNEYRILAIIPGQRVESISFRSTGDYDVRYTTATED